MLNFEVAGKAGPKNGSGLIPQKLSWVKKTTSL